MKKAIIVFVIFGATVVGGAWLARNLAFGQAADKKDESITMTKTQWEKLVQERVALALKEKSQPVSDQQVLQADNWHTAVYKNIEYTVYTGPGQFFPLGQKQQPKATPKAASSKTPKATSSTYPAK